MLAQLVMKHVLNSWKLGHASRREPRALRVSDLKHPDSASVKLLCSYLDEGEPTVPYLDVFPYFSGGREREREMM